MNTFTAVIHQEDDLYATECPEVGTASQGTTIAEAFSNLKEATELYLEEFPFKIVLPPHSYHLRCLGPCLNCQRYPAMSLSEPSIFTFSSKRFKSFQPGGLIEPLVKAGKEKV